MNDFNGRRTRNVQQDHSDGKLCVPDAKGYCPCPLKDAPSGEAELVCSDVGGDRHMPVIDLDYSSRLLPSATAEHFHLYLDKSVAWDDYLAVLKAMAGAGLVEYGFYDATVARGFSAVRHPDRPKGYDA